MLVDRDLLSNPRRDECLQAPSQCVYGEGPVGLILIGDSHADAVVTAIESALAPEIGGILFKGDSGCISLPGLDHTDPRKQECLQMGDSIPDLLLQYPGVPVLLIARLSEHANGGQIQPDQTASFYVRGGTSRYSADWFSQFSDWYLRTVCEVASAHPVWLMRPTPEMTVDVANQLGRHRMINRQYDLSLPRIEHDKRHRYIRALQDEVVAQCDVRIIDPTEILCDEERCIAEHNGLPIYRDDDHLSEYGNRLLIPLFRTMLDQWPR
nr:SGNH hydrolase domain-containing protein [Alcanivorax quisquiliarum]